MGRIKVNIEYSRNYGAYSEEVPGCVATGRTLEDVKKAYSDALEMHIKGMLEDGDQIPDVLRGEILYEYELDVPALLHATEKIVSWAALSRASGVNQRQLCHYAAGRSHPRPEQRQKIVQGLRNICAQLSTLVI